MTSYTLPPDNKQPIVLQAGDTLTVLKGGKSHNITVNDGAIETVNQGGVSDHTTLNGNSVDAGTENVHDGTADFTTLNGGFLNLDHGIANHTRLNDIGSQLDVRGASVINDTTIQNGLVHLDVTSIADGVKFVFQQNQKFTDARLQLDNPLSVKGDISGFHVGDKIEFAAGIQVTGFSATKDTVTINFNEAGISQHIVTYHFKDVQPHTEFKLVDNNTIVLGIVGTHLAHDADHLAWV
jgi:autotransporter passenger strand-loop-strand repeat protein